MYLVRSHCQQKTTKIRKTALNKTANQTKQKRIVNGKTVSPIYWNRIVRNDIAKQCTAKETGAEIDLPSTYICKAKQQRKKLERDLVRK